LDGLGQLEQLERLDLNGTRITDKAVSIFSKLHALRWVNLAGTNTTGW